MHVLLIEDDLGLTMFYKRALQRAGYFVSTETRGDSGLEAAIAQKPDLMVVDWYLPGMDGISLVKKLRADGYEKPILVLSGSGETIRDQAMNAGADAFLSKPCGLDELTHCVAMLTSRSLVYDLSDAAA